MPPGGRSDALGAGIVDPAAAIERGARVEPRPQVPAAVAHPKRYFGPGPAPEREDDAWPAPAAAAAGIALVVCAVLLYRGARPPERAGGRPTTG
ncbi:hypothetical protein V1L54_06875 [Streptomyces sp. TRM 70361]|uniref:hypothetical protein n=1 Tax=Streptomyces sp. TRM 70361 TaxID=3116553 RepID=UPI002E7BAA28|nr:hypothetical protein [Streptomyces sp. TRM 70361]MEE1939134.1 hypothetical protein [Streptomyces sp. TRM 70361]